MKEDTLYSTFMPHGWVEVIAGCMYSGKSEELVRRLRRAVYAKQKVMAFKPSIDDRYHATDIASHSGITFSAVPVVSFVDIYDRTKDAQVVGIDEVQFFDESIVEIIQALAKQGKRVICAGLNTDYRGEPFPGPMPELMAVADEVVTVFAVCTVCGQPATRTQRLVNSGSHILVGSAGIYEARCRMHHSYDEEDA